MIEDDEQEPHDGRTFQFVCHVKGDVSLHADEKVGTFTMPDAGSHTSDEALAYLEEAVREVYGQELANGLVLRGADGTVLCTADDLRRYVTSVVEAQAARGPILFFREATVGPRQWQIPLRVRSSVHESESVLATFVFSLPWRARPISHLALEEQDEEGDGMFDDGPLAALRKTCVDSLHLDDSPSKRFVALMSLNGGESVTTAATDKQVEEYFAQWVHRVNELQAAQRQEEGGDEAEEGSSCPPVHLDVDVAVILEERDTIHKVAIEFVLGPAHGAVSTFMLMSPGTPPEEQEKKAAAVVAKVLFEYNPSRMHGVLLKLKSSALSLLQEAGLCPPSQEPKGDDDDDDDDEGDDGWGVGASEGPKEVRNIFLIAETPLCGDIALTNDWAVENMLNQLSVPIGTLVSSPLQRNRSEEGEGDVVLRIRVDRSESSEFMFVDVHCRLREGSSAPGGLSEIHKFRHRFGRDEPNIVSQLRSACAASIGGSPLSANDLMLCTLDDGEEVQIGSDAMLRELLQSHSEQEHPLLITVQRKRKVVVLERLVVCQLHDDYAQFSYRFVVDDSNLLASFREECKAELDLLPSDNVSLFAQIGGPGETVPLSKDSALREALLANREQPLQVLLVRKPPSGRRGSRDVAMPLSFSAKAPGASLRQMQRPVECTVGRKKVSFVFSFRLDEEGLLDHLHTCCKQAHNIGIDSRVKLTLNHLDADVLCSRDLSTDAQLREVLSDDQGFPHLTVTALVFSTRRASVTRTTDSTQSASASPGIPPSSRDTNELGGSYSELDGASIDGSRASTRERRQHQKNIGECFDDSSCDSSAAPTPVAGGRRAPSWNEVAREGGDSPLGPRKQQQQHAAGGAVKAKPSLYDCFADDPEEEDSVMRDGSSEVGGDSRLSSGNTSGAANPPMKGATSNTSTTIAGTVVTSSKVMKADVEGEDYRSAAQMPDGGDAPADRNLYAHKESPTDQPQMSPSPPPKEKKPSGYHNIRSLIGPTSLQPAKKFRVVGDPVVDLIERRMRERRAAEKARRDKERQRMDEVMSEIEARRQKHLEDAKEHQLLEQRRKQEEAERRAEEVRRREEERLKRISTLKVDPSIIAGKRSVLDALDEKRRRAQQEEEERLAKARIEARERLSWNHQFHQQLDEHQHLVLERLRRREQEKKAHAPLLDQPILPPDVADIIKTNAYMRVVSESNQPLRTVQDKKEELRRQREARMSYYDHRLGGDDENGAVSGTHEHRPVEYPSRIRGEEAKKEELRKLREARMRYYEHNPHVAPGGGGAHLLARGSSDGDGNNSSNNTPRQRRIESGGAEAPAVVSLTSRRKSDQTTVIDRANSGSLEATPHPPAADSNQPKRRRHKQEDEAMNNRSLEQRDLTPVVESPDKTTKEGPFQLSTSDKMETRDKKKMPAALETERPSTPEKNGAELQEAIAKRERKERKAAARQQKSQNTGGDDHLPPSDGAIGMADPGSASFPPPSDASQGDKSPRRRSMRKGSTTSPQTMTSVMLMPEDDGPTAALAPGTDGPMSDTYGSLSGTGELDESSARARKRREGSKQRESEDRMEAIPSIVDEEGDLMPDSPE
jgi:hypothetical protein